MGDLRFEEKAAAARTPALRPAEPGAWVGHRAPGGPGASAIRARPRVARWLALSLGLSAVVAGCVASEGDSRDDEGEAPPQISYCRPDKDFGLDRAWSRAPTCDSAEGAPHLSARVRLRVARFRIPARYAEIHDPRRILSGMEMARYRFALDYEQVTAVLDRAQVRCPFVTPPPPPPGSP